MPPWSAVIALTPYAAFASPWQQNPPMVTAVPESVANAPFPTAETPPASGICALIVPPVIVRALPEPNVAPLPYTNTAEFRPLLLLSSSELVLLLLVIAGLTSVRPEPLFFTQTALWSVPEAV
ncbi:hypothetical protein [Paracidobacterium acidisoli]|nr:hypothetical protein [Paracidobacterium acidisoli]MBT9331160.1 hypothetical protein [Paracidobacterium acidisoli]